MGTDTKLNNVATPKDLFAELEQARQINKELYTLNTTLNTLVGEQEQELATLREANEKMEKALEELEQWARAYPVKTFPEPDFKKAHELLTAGGMTLDSISASNMRHVVTRMIEIVHTALPPAPEEVEK